MTDDIVAAGTYSDFKIIKTRGVFQVHIEMPLEGAPDFISKFGLPNPSAEIMVAVARLNTASLGREEKIYEEGSPEHLRSLDLPAGSFIPTDKNLKAKSYAQEAGILCGTSAFFRFLTDKNPMLAGENARTILSSDDAARSVREYCGVASRRDLIEGTPAGNKFRDLRASFNAWKEVG